MSHDYSAYIGHNNPPNNLLEIAELAEQQLKAAQEVEIAERNLKDKKEQLREISERILPEKMEQLGLQDYTTTSGTHIEVEDKTKGYLTIENRNAGFDWMERSGFGPLIKQKLTVLFGKKDFEKAKSLLVELLDRGFVAGMEREVHWKTMDAFIRNQLAEGNSIPLEIFSVDRKKITSVTLKE